MDKDTRAERIETIRRFDGLNRRVEMKVIAGKSGLKALSGDRKHFATIAYMNAGHIGDDSPFIRAANLAAVAMQHHNGDRQIASHGCFVFGGEATIGGNANPDADDVGGIWTSLVDGEEHMKGDLPEGKAHPEGLLKDVTKTEGAYALWSTAHRFKRKNQRLREQMSHAFDLADAQESISTTSKMRLPVLFVIPDEAGRVVPRWRNYDDPAQSAALDAIDTLVARRTTDGSWPLGSLSDPMATAGCRAEVTDVTRDTVTLRPVDEDGELIERRMPANAIRQHIGKIAGMDVEDLPVMPVVMAGRIVGPNTPLFGPHKAKPASVLSLRRDVVQAEGDAAQLASRHLTLLRLYALAAEATPIPQMADAAFPIALVTPPSRQRVVAQVAGDGWDLRVQRVQLTGTVDALSTSRTGQAADLFRTSQRARMRLLEDQRKREKKRLARTKKRKAASVQKQQTV